MKIDLLKFAQKYHINSLKSPTFIKNVSIDTRSLKPESLFIALHGKNFDGHTFIDEAIKKKCKAIMIEHKNSNLFKHLSIPKLIVDNTHTALGYLATYFRQTHKKKLIAITGSNGKTTTKDLCASILEIHAPVHKTMGNFNNLIGMSLTLLSWEKKSWAAVIEMGMNTLGEISELAEIASPNIALITNIAPAHLENLKDLETVAKAKFELFEHLKKEDIAIINKDDPFIQNFKFHKNISQITFGMKKNCHIRLLQEKTITSKKGIKITLEIDGKKTNIEIPVYGRHNAVNACAAAACAFALGLSTDEIIQGLSRANPPKSRMETKSINIDAQNSEKKVHIIDDSYNANPESMYAALLAQKEMANTSRRICILGDMNELGKKSTEFHYELGKQAMQLGVFKVFTYGEKAKDISKAMDDLDGNYASYTNIQVLLNDILAELKDDDWILIKGSRGMYMEQIVKKITERTKEI